MDIDAAADGRPVPHGSAGDAQAPRRSPRAGLRPADVAITGMSAIMPGASDLRAFWDNILDTVGAVGEVPPERWPVDRYFDPDRGAPDKINSKWGGFIPDVPFDPTRFGIPPAAVASIDPAQLLALVGAEAALADAGLAAPGPELRRRASVILGFTGGLGELGVQYAARAELARALPATPPEALDFLPRWTSDSFAGLLPNVVAGRIANRFDFGGASFVVDAACAASLAALRQAVVELETGRSDLVLCGAVETGQGPFAFTCFSKAHALSPRGRCRAFDAGADGTAISEGIAFLVLRRLEDARAAGDRIYAVIKGVDGSSDGRARGLMAPLPEGQARALRRAYEQAGYSPAGVDLFEAHGTGTVAGDAAEIESLSTLLLEHGAAPRSCAVGSVKALIGHAKGAAGLAGVIKAALGLHHRVLPPHAGVEQPNAALHDPACPIALRQRAQPWLPRQGAGGPAPRRAGVSAFGFGGANYHVTLEEHAADGPGRRRAPRDRWPAELFVWRAATRAALAAALAPGLAALRAGAAPPLGGLARALAAGLGEGRVTLAIVAGTHAQLATLLAAAVERLRDPEDARVPPPGLSLCDAPLAADGTVAMLFPGQGSQYPDMARDLAATFDEVGAALEAADAVLADTPTYRGRPDPRLSRLVYPFDRFGEAEEEGARRALAETDVAQPALGAVEGAMLALLARLGVTAGTAAGHSYGEYVALHAAGVLSRPDLLRVSEARGRCIVGAVRDGDLGTMAAVSADPDTVRGALAGADGVVVANLNAPNQTVISGTRAGVADAVARFGARGLTATPLPVSAAFHSPLVQPAQAPLVRVFDTLDWAAPRIPVYSNTTAMPHDPAPARIRALLERHLTEPVDFTGTVEAMYAAGARVFLEVGPKTVLTGLTRRILGTRPHCAAALEGAGGGLPGLLHALAAIIVQGARCDLARLFAGRDLPSVDPADWGGARESPAGRPAVSWLLNGTRARPADAPAPTAVAPAAPLPAPPPPPARSAAGRAAPPTRLPQTRTPPMHGSDGPLRLDDDGSGDPQASGVDRAMAEYHRTMRHFLEVQERLMLAYLEGGERAPRPFSAPRPAAPRPAMAQPAAAPRPERPAPPPVAALPVAPPPARPAPAPVVPAAPPPSAPVAPAAADPKALLLKLASACTGYPEDMLGLTLDMEADLGIDSIKRVEILAAFRKAQPAAVADFLSPRMAQVSKARTLQDVLDHLGAALGEMEGTARPFDRAGPAEGAAPLVRYVMRPEAETLPPGQPAAVVPGTYLVVPDRTGVAGAFAALLERDGAAVRLVPEGVAGDDAAAEAWLATVRASGPIRGLISLAPVTPPGPAPDWRGGMEVCVKSLFPLLRLLGPDLAAGGTVAVASAMGGHFARDALRVPARATLFPGAGGGVGLVKSLAAEWPGCRGKAVDLDPAEGPARQAAQLHAEVAAPAGRREVGYPGGVRTVFRTVPAPLRTEAAVARPGPGWVVLAVGGARGITAETARPFAAAGATLVVVGRAAPPGPEEPATAALADAGALRAHFLAEAAATGARPTPAGIQTRIATVLRDREIRANLADFASLGARVEHRLCDVRDEAQVEAMLEAVYARHGRVDAVLLGAGLIEDRLLVDKTRESLNRVFDTKVDAAHAFARHLRPATLQYLALFTSVAGRYGNRGQADYAAANEVLNRFAWQLQAQYGARVKVTAMNWGAWARTTNGPGMLTPDTARQFRERGLKLIEPDQGRDALWNELLFAPRDEVEVVVGEHPWEAQEAEAARPGAPARAVA